MRCWNEAAVQPVTPTTWPPARAVGGVAFEPAHPGVVGGLDRGEGLVADLGAAEEGEHADGLLGGGGDVVADPHGRAAAPVGVGGEVGPGDPVVAVPVSPADEVGALGCLAVGELGVDLGPVFEVAAAEPGQVATAGADEPGGGRDGQVLVGVAAGEDVVAGHAAGDERLDPGQLGLADVAGPVLVDVRDERHPGVVPARADGQSRARARRCRIPVAFVACTAGRSCLPGPIATHAGTLSQFGCVVSAFPVVVPAHAGSVSGRRLGPRGTGVDVRCGRPGQGGHGAGGGEVFALVDGLADVGLGPAEHRGDVPDAVERLAVLAPSGNRPGAEGCDPAGGAPGGDQPFPGPRGAPGEHGGEVVEVDGSGEGEFSGALAHPPAGRVAAVGVVAAHGLLARCPRLPCPGRRGSRSVGRGR